jgi:hypothetical protein
LPNISVIPEKKRERNDQNARSACNAGVSLVSLELVIREKQGARLLAQQREAGKKIAENTWRLPTG